MSAEKEAEELARKGYAITSRKYGLASRVDRENWREYLKRNRHPVCADWYRRVISKDRVDVSPSVQRYMPKSGDFPGPHGDKVR